MVDKTIEAEAAQGLQPPQILDVLTASILTIPTATPCHRVMINTSSYSPAVSSDRATLPSHSKPYHQRTDLCIA
ncbi:unnamed protein product [Aspergillus oryzae]|uniref:Unnamed protein product n=2 Tax=Aspergillus oryzae TaxID=5062 RepID=A0AAN5BRH6_ASPOZ|nr:unnamed protein product [Aspergillus oryzae]GMF86198.1 unnamed protein product [Aspergillus oryzae]GMG02495.1 unnamed protein product [Aspergillus oryzae]GMG22383.1 unnamed protein product [Aspergillus oryzae]GMG53327.1 unnamed protein product [Aspergillus oryzae var. brunneus]